MKHLLESVPVRALSVLVRFLPMSVVRACGRGLGRLVYMADRARRRTTLTNLSAAFPGRPAAEHRAVAQAMFGHFGSLLLLLKWWRHFVLDNFDAGTVTNSILAIF